MIPVKHAPHRPTSDNIRGFRGIRHSTHSRRLFTGLGGSKKLPFGTLKLEPGGFDFGDFKLSGGHLETKWLGKGLDGFATQLFAKLQGGGVLSGFLGNLLASAYRPMRFGILNKLVLLLYQIMIKVLTAIHNFFWHILFIPLAVIALVLTAVILVDFSFVFELFGQAFTAVFNFFTDIFSGLFE